MTQKVTILMPVYNGAHHLKEAIESVLKQTYRDFIFLIIDDASTDRSVDLINAYSDKRIRLVQNDKNIGQTATLNRGLKLARSKYIARLDQDDMCLPTRLEEQVAFLDSNPRVAVIGTWMKIINEKGIHTKTLSGSIPGNAYYIFALLQKRGIVGHPTVMLRAEALDKLGGYDDSFSLSEDLDLWMRTIQAGYQVRIIEKPLNCYRTHNNQQSSTQHALQEKSARKANKKFIEFYLGSIPSKRIIYFFLKDEKFLNNASFVKMLSFVNALHTLLVNIKTRTKMDINDYSELKQRTSELLLKNIFIGMENQLRINSLPLFLLLLYYNPKILFSRDSARYLLFLTWILPFIRKAIFSLKNKFEL